MKIEWTIQIPRKSGNYLFKCPETGIIELKCITTRDIDIQEINAKYLPSGFYSERIEEE